MNDAPHNGEPSPQDGPGAPLTDGALSVSAGREVREAEVKKAVTEILSSTLRSAKPAEKQEIATRIASMVVMQEETYSGDIPHPSHLRGFEDIVPGSARKIIDNAVNESEHRRWWENKALDGHFRLASRAQIFGFVLSLGLIIGGFVLGLLDRTIVGCAMLVPGVLGTAFNLIKGSQQHREAPTGSNQPEPRSTHSKKSGAKQQQIARRKS